MLPYYRVSRSHQHAKSGRSTVPNGHLIFLYRRIPVVGAEAPAANDVGCAIKPWSENAIRSAGHSTRVRCTPIYVIVLQIEHYPPGVIMLKHCIMYVVYPSRLSCGA